MKASLKEALQQGQHEKDGSREVERHKRVLGMVLAVSETMSSRCVRTASLSLEGSGATSQICLILIAINPPP